MKIPINEVFLSIQGEGRYAGKTAFFLRLQGCDYRCSWCDSKSSVPPPTEGQYWSFTKLYRHLRSLSLEVRTIVVTGGNPLFYKNIAQLIERLYACGFSIHIETQGTYLHRIRRVRNKIAHIAIAPKLDTVCGEKRIGLATDINKFFRRSWRERLFSKAMPTLDIKYPCVTVYDTRDFLQFGEKIRVSTKHLYAMVRWIDGMDYKTTVEDFLQKNQAVMNYYIQPQIHRLIYDEREGV